MSAGTQNRFSELEVLQGIGRNLLIQFLPHFETDLAASPCPPGEGPAPEPGTLNLNPNLNLRLPSRGGEGRGEGEPLIGNPPDLRENSCNSCLAASPISAFQR